MPFHYYTRKTEPCSSIKNRIDLECDPFFDDIIGVFGVFDKIVAEVIFGVFNPTGKLPFDLPSSTEELLNQKSDIPDDTKNPIYSYGYGLNYSL